MEYEHRAWLWHLRLGMMVTVCVKSAAFQSDAGPTCLRSGLPFALLIKASTTKWLGMKPLHDACACQLA